MQAPPRGSQASQALLHLLCLAIKPDEAHCLHKEFTVELVSAPQLACSQKHFWLLEDRLQRNISSCSTSRRWISLLWSDQTSDASVLFLWQTTNTDISSSHLTCHQIRWGIPALPHKVQTLPRLLFSSLMFLHSHTFVHSTLIPILNNTGSFIIKWRKLKGLAFCPRSHWKSSNEFPMVKHLSSFPPSGNDSHVSEFQMTLLNETKLFLECSPCHHLLL